MISPDITERFILLSFDIEEFDIAGEYGLEVEGEALFAPSLLGLQRLLALLEKLGMVATFFVTVAFASRYPALIAQMAKTHEIASHGMRHDGVNDEDYKASRMALEAITGKPVHGFRMPRMQPVSMPLLQSAGYRYDSSLHPTFLPGRYNHWAAPRTPYQECGVWEIPASVTPILRFPLFWLAFKNAPLCFIRYASSRCLATDRYLCLYYHSWEYADLAAHALPRHVASPSGEVLLKRLESYLVWLTARGRFVTFSAFVNSLLASSD